MGVSLASCAPAPSGVVTAAATTEPARPQGTSTPGTALTIPAASTSTPEIAASAANPAGTVRVLARGNLFIRRGPDLAFNPISVLMEGQMAYPTGRDVLSRWLQIPLPADPLRTGWISIMSDFTEITGDAHALQEIEPVEWPTLAFVRNCTYHQMILKPGDIIIPAIIYFPDNDVQVNPGRYKVLDLELDGYPDIRRIDVSEGSAVDIIVDGLGMKKKCPEL